MHTLPRFLLLLSLSTLLLSPSACDDDPQSNPTTAQDTPQDTPDTSPPLTDPLGLDLVLPSPSPATQLAAADLISAFATIRGTNLTDPSAHILSSPDAVDAPSVITITVGDTTLTHDQAYSIHPIDLGGGRTGLEIKAKTDIGAMYGMYDIAQHMGALYIHPEQTFYPQNPSLTLPNHYTGVQQQPAFDTRGFHEHTQHPTEMSDFMLRPGDPAFRTYASNYLKWLARNRQNLLSFHLLKTTDLDAWIPYISDIHDEAQRLGVQLGVVLSIADQQQNNFKLIRDDITDPLTGQVPPPDKQIRDTLDRLWSSNLDFLVLQIGTSEFTKPSDADVLSWLDTALTHTASNYPSKKLHAWIHIFCDLEADDGGYFYHLPGRADPSLGAWVHTTMFYTLTHPAPVYSCDTFSHHIDFMRAQDGRREQTFFPESAWWLGFDNNLPLALPITGWSRAYDIDLILRDHQVSGHVTFTTGKEWSYWQYDHYVMTAGWEGALPWDTYLDRLSPLYGDAAPSAISTLKAWTNLQVKHFYQDNPLIYFYLAGELPQDELGERAGILARRPKPSFQSILSLDDAAFAAWTASDLAMLSSMESAYAALLSELPPIPPGQEDSLYAELYDVLDLYVRRITHARTLYEGVSLVRSGDRAAAEAKLADARAISQAAQATLQAASSRYRYPLDLLIADKPASLTSYPYGYLKEAHSAYFWHRRDDQLDRLILRAFDPSSDAWTQSPDLLFFTNSANTQMKVPSDRVAATVISSFVPQMLFGLSNFDPAGGVTSLQVAEDYNENFLPDEGTEAQLQLTRNTQNLWEGRLDTFSLSVHDTTDNLVGTLPIYDALFSLSLLDDGRTITDLSSCDLTGQINPQELIAIIRSVAGIDVNGAENLIKQVYKLPPEEPIPDRLPIHFTFSFNPAQ